MNSTAVAKICPCLFIYEIYADYMINAVEVPGRHKKQSKTRQYL